MLLLRLALLTLLLSFAPLASPTAASAQNVEGVAAIVNDEVISTYDVRQRMRLILISTGIRPDQNALRRIQAQALSSLIDERLQLQAAAEFEIVVEEDEVEDSLSRLAQQNNATSEDIRRDLAAQGIDLETLEQQLRSEIAWQILVGGRFRSRLRVSDDQIDNRLERLAANADSSSYLVSEIVIEPPPGAEEAEVVEAVESVMAPLQQGAPFPAVARQFSASPTAATGGDMGWVLAGELQPELESALQQMQPGQVSPPIQTNEGIYIIALRDRRAGVNAERLRLSQIIVPLPADASESAIAEAEQALSRQRDRVDSCEDLQDAASRIDGAIASELGAVSPGDLAPDFRDAIEALEEGETSEPIRGGGGVVVVAMCGREIAAGEILPSREQIEDRLLDEQLSLLARRYLRDLRRDATIETRLR